MRTISMPRIRKDSKVKTVCHKYSQILKRLKKSVMGKSDMKQ